MLAYLIIAALMGALIYLLYRQGLASSKWYHRRPIRIPPWEAGRQRFPGFLHWVDPACRALSSEPDIRVSP